MSLLLEEINERIKNWDEVYILERLEITSDELVERFQDKIEEKADKLEEEVEE